MIGRRDIGPTESLALSTIDNRYALAARLASILPNHDDKRMRPIIKNIIKFGDRTGMLELVREERSKQRRVRRARWRLKHNYSILNGWPASVVCGVQPSYADHDVYGVCRPADQDQQDVFAIKAAITRTMFQVVFLTPIGSWYGLTSILREKWDLPKSYDPIPQQIMVTPEGPVASILVGARRVLLWRRRGIFIAAKLQGVSGSRPFDLNARNVETLRCYHWKELRMRPIDY